MGRMESAFSFSACRLVSFSSEAAQEPRGIARVDARLGDVFGNNGAGTNDDAVANRDRHNRGVGSDADVVSDHSCAPEFALPFGGSALLEGVVDKHGAVGNETIVADRDQFADEGVRLDPATPADGDVRLNLDEGPDKTAITEGAAVKINRLDDGNVRPKRDVDDSDRAQLRFVFQFRR